ncbi:hypothetical protein Tco_1197752 [Tanacetum coccineum]
MPPKSASLTQAAVRRMIKECVDVAIAAERVRHANAGNNASGSGQARGQVTAPVVRECTFAGFMKCNPDNFCGTEGAAELRRCFEKTEMNFRISECAEDKKVKFVAATLRGPALTWWNSKSCNFETRSLMCPRMVEPESVKVDAYIRGLSNNIKGMKGFLKEISECGNNSGKINHKDNSRQSSQNNQKQWNARAMTTAPNERMVSSGSLPVGQCTIKCHKCGKIRHKARYCKEKNVATGANAQPI